MITIPYPRNPDIQALFIPISDKFDNEVKLAKEADSSAAISRGRGYYLNAIQEHHQGMGAYVMQITTNKYGFALWDTHNDGIGNLARQGCNASEVLQLAYNFYSKDPEKRTVIIGFISDEFKEEFDKALEEF